MKKKIFNIAIIMLSVFFAGKIKAAAQTEPVSVPVWDIPADTYIIGTHMFDENRTYLSTQDIMWAARTIQGNSKEDMVIYYKDLNNYWVDGLSGEPVTIPSSFQIEEVNEEIANHIGLLGITDTNTGLPDYNLFMDENSFSVTNEAAKNYTINFGAYNIEDENYDFSFECSATNEEDEEISLNLGVIPNNVTVTNNRFTLPITIAQSTPKNSYICTMNLGENEQYFEIEVGEKTPSIEVNGMVANISNENGEGMEPVLKQNSNEFYYGSNTDELVNIAFSFNVFSKYLTEGSHSLTVTAKKDGQNFELEDVPSNINIEYDSDINKYSSYFYFSSSTNFTNGEYEFDIIIDETETTIYLTIGAYHGFELTSIYNNTDEMEYDSNNTIFTSEKDKKYTATFETVNIPNGVYNVWFSAEGVPIDILSNKTVEVNNNTFDFSYVIPKDFIGRQIMFLTLLDNNGTVIADGNFIFDISSTTQSGLKLLLNPLFTNFDVHIFDRDEITGGGNYKLLLQSQKPVDGFEVFMANNPTEDYLMIRDIDNETLVTSATINVVIPLNTTKYYKIKPYKIVNEVKTYSEESNVVEIYDNLQGAIQFKFQEGTDNIDVTLDEDNNALLKIYAIQNLMTLPSGYVIEESDSTSFAEFSVIKNQTFNSSNIGESYFDDEISVTIPYGETKYYRLRSYVNVNSEKVYSQGYSIIHYTNSQQ